MYHLNTINYNLYFSDKKDTISSGKSDAQWCYLALATSAYFLPTLLNRDIIVLAVSHFWRQMFLFYKGTLKEALYPVGVMQVGAIEQRKTLLQVKSCSSTDKL